LEDCNARNFIAKNIIKNSLYLKQQQQQQRQHCMAASKKIARFR
jgi:hypothetical protein